MRLRVIAVGTRISEWVQAATHEYARRLHGPEGLEFIEVPPGKRSGAGDVARAMGAESAAILARVEPRSFLVALDERGRQFSSLQLSEWLAARRQSGEPLNFVIGGPDGLGPEVLARAQLKWSLSALTFPHGLVRVLLAEQLYRASTLLAGHPYHRE
jgi:23S rRNA (pseudouridine1915-N3)-methyltransferase